jgi:hypothetical protein
MVESAPHEQINHPIGAAMAAVAARIDIITLGLSIGAEGGIKPALGIRSPVEVFNESVALTG